MSKRKKATVRRRTNDATVEVLAKEISAIAKGVRKLMAGPLKRSTVTLLISKSSGIGIRNVEKVLEAAESLDVEYLEDADADGQR